MTARLRTLPMPGRCLSETESTDHYLILDGVGWTRAEVDQAVAAIGPKIREAGGVLLVFAPEVSIPEVDAEELEPTTRAVLHAGSEYLPGETHDNATARRLAQELLELVGESSDTATSVTVDAEGNITVDKIDNTVDRNHRTVDYVSDFRITEPEDQRAVRPCSECASDAGHNAESRQEAPTEPDYGTQWERWLGMMAKYEAQTTEAAQAVLDQAEAPAPVCKASREVEASGWVICDGQGHDREHHSGRLTTGPGVGNRYAWPFGPSDRAKLEESAQTFHIVVNVDNSHPLDVGHQLLAALREHHRVMVRA